MHVSVGLSIFPLIADPGFIHHLHLIFYHYWHSAVLPLFFFFFFRYKSSKIYICDEAYHRMEKKKKKERKIQHPSLSCILQNAFLVRPAWICWICSSHWLSVHGLFSLPVNVGYPVMHAWCMYSISIKRPGLRFHWHLVASRHSSAETESERAS